MTETDLQRLLDDVRAGTIDATAASTRIREALSAAPFEDLGFARVDIHRTFRQGFPEVILGLGKTPSQIAAIAMEHGGTLATNDRDFSRFPGLDMSYPLMENL